MRPSSRARLAFALVGLAAGTVAGCAHAPPPPPPPPPAKPGWLLRLKTSPGEATAAKVKLLIEQDLASWQGEQGGARHITLSFRLTDEERVDAVTDGGISLISARLLDVVGEASAGVDQRKVDAFALALDELKIQFSRTARGSAGEVKLAGVRAPLEEQTARTIANAIYGAGRGPILPEKPVAVGDEWTVETPAPSALGLAGTLSYRYTLARQGGGVAVLMSRGKIEGRAAQPGAARRLSGTSESEIRVELESGRLIGLISDATTQIEQESTTSRGNSPSEAGVRQRVRAEWLYQ